MEGALTLARGGSWEEGRATWDIAFTWQDQALEENVERALLLLRIGRRGWLHCFRTGGPI